MECLNLFRAYANIHHCSTDEHRSKRACANSLRMRKRGLFHLPSPIFYLRLAQLCLKVCAACANYLHMRKRGLFHLPSSIFYHRLALCLALISALQISRADNPCIEGGPHYTNWTCAQPGSVLAAGALGSNNLTVCLGNTLVPPVLATVPTFNNGQKRHYAAYDCNPALDGYVTNSVLYQAGPLYFTSTNSSWPPITGPFTNAGTFYYTAEAGGLPVSLEGWWPAESNATDLVWGHNGALHGNAAYAPGGIGQA